MRLFIKVLAFFGCLFIGYAGVGFTGHMPESMDPWKIFEWVTPHWIGYLMVGMGVLGPLAIVLDNGKPKS